MHAGNPARLTCHGGNHSGAKADESDGVVVGVSHKQATLQATADHGTASR